MKDFKYKINGNLYKVSINSVDESVAEVEVNGTPYKVQLDKPAKKQIKPLTRPQAAPVTPTGEPVVSRPVASTTAGAEMCIRDSNIGSQYRFIPMPITGM